MSLVDDYAVNLYKFLNADMLFAEISRSCKVKVGGHDVPGEKTVARYYRCLEQVKYALPYLNRAYFFDNSSDQQFFFAEYEQGKGFQLYSELVPEWFKHFILGE